MSTPTTVETTETSPRPHLRPAALPMDLLETEDALILVANLPGVRREDLHISLEGDDLTVSADRHEPVPASTGDDSQPTPLFRELGGVRWERRFRLRTPIAVDDIQATLEGGVLQLTLPKAPEIRPRRIEVKVG